MHLYLPILFFIVLFLAELLYFRIANHYNIIDKPNHRSSHTQITIRGGGIIFTIGLLLYSIYTGFIYPYFLIGLVAISTISFVDDVKPASNKVRILVHLLAVALMFYQLNMFVLPFYWILLALIFAIGAINAINFMDGVNGITGGYGLVTLGTLYYINSSLTRFTSNNLLLIAILAVLVFNFFNFRTKAKCFAGDVGSVSLAFIILFFLLSLIIKTKNPYYFILLLVYGLDTFTTIMFRLIRRENIFEAHRHHFYQYLANEKKIPHLLVAGLYMFVQIIVNTMLITFLTASDFNLALLVTIATMIFILIRLFMEGPKRLFYVTE